MKKEISRIFEVPKIHTFEKDNRMPIEKIYRNLSKIDGKSWKKEIITQQQIIMNKKKYDFNILGLTTKKKGPALWIIAGIHGEEPAGPNAIAKKNKYYKRFGGENSHGSNAIV